MTKFILDAMYYQIFIFNRDKFILENPHERTIQIICGILFLPVIVLTYLLIKENFNYKTPFVFFIIIYVLLYKTFCSYYIKRKKGMEIIRSKPLIFNIIKISSFISWMIYPILVVLLYFKWRRISRLFPSWRLIVASMVFPNGLYTATNHQRVPSLQCASTNSVLKTHSILQKSHWQFYRLRSQKVEKLYLFTTCSQLLYK